jgi:hypothetical protein
MPKQVLVMRGEMKNIDIPATNHADHEEGKSNFNAHFDG